MPLQKMANRRLDSAESLQRITLPIVRLPFYHASLSVCLTAYLVFLELTPNFGTV